jgi:hypothetical protein
LEVTGSEMLVEVGVETTMGGATSRAEALAGVSVCRSRRQPRRPALTTAASNAVRSVLMV